MAYINALLLYELIIIDTLFSKQIYVGLWYILHLIVQSIFSCQLDKMLNKMDFAKTLKLMPLLFAAFISACHSDKREDKTQASRQNTVSIESASSTKSFVYYPDQPSYVASKTTIHSYVTEVEEGEPNKLAILVKTLRSNEWLAAFEDIVLMIVVPVEAGAYDATTAEVIYKPDNQRIFTASEFDPNTFVDVQVESMGEVNNFATGTYKVKLCLEQAIQIGRCTTEENVVELSGHFDVVRDADEVAISQGTLEAPLDLGPTPLERNNLFILDNNSYYRIGLQTDRLYRLTVPGLAEPLQVDVFLDDQFSQLICSIVPEVITEEETAADAAADESEEAEKEPLTNNCDFDSQGHTQAYVLVSNTSDTEFSGRRLRLQAEIIGPFKSKGNGEEPEYMGSVPRHIKFKGTVNSEQEASFYVVTVDPKTNYTVTLTNETGVAPLLMSVVGKEQGYCASSSQCIVRAQENFLGIIVEDNGTERGAAFTIEINRSGFFHSKQGARETPLAIAGNQIIGTTGNSINSSYYRIDVQEGDIYSLSFSADDEDYLLMKVYDNMEAMGDPDAPEDAPEPEGPLCDAQIYCTVSSKDGDSSLIVNVLSLSPAGSTFTLTANEILSYEDQGSEETPLDISADMSGAGEFFGEINVENSYYTLEVSGEQAYTVVMDQLPDPNLDFEVYDNGTMVCRSGFATIDSKTCSAFISGNTIEIHVVQKSSALPVAGSFRLTATAGGQTYESAGSIIFPVTLDGALPRLLDTGETNIQGSYYSYPVISGETYTVTLTNINGDNPELWIAAGDTNCSSSNPGHADEECIITIPADTETLYIVATGSYLASGASYDLSIK